MILVRRMPHKVMKSNDRWELSSTSSTLFTASLPCFNLRTIKTLNEIKSHD